MALKGCRSDLMLCSSGGILKVPGSSECEACAVQDVRLWPHLPV